MGNLPEVLQGAQISSTHNKIGHPYHALQCRNLGSSKMLRICLKNKVHTSQLVNANIKWHFHDTGRHVRRTFKTKCKLLSWETSLSGAVKPRFSTALRSEPGGWGSNEIRDSQMWAASPLREDLPTCSSEPSLVGWHERGWCWQGAGSRESHPWASLMETSWVLLSHPALSEPPGPARGTVALPLLPGQAGDLFHPQCVKYLEEPTSHWGSMCSGAWLIRDFKALKKLNFLTIIRTKFQNLLKMVCLRSGGPFYEALGEVAIA